jgi:hypothetical protein
MIKVGAKVKGDKYLGMNGVIYFLFHWSKIPFHNIAK